MNIIKSENFWLKASAITFLVTLIGGIVIQYGVESESARIICLSLFGVSGLYMFTEIIITERKFLKNLIRFLGYPMAVVISIFIVNALGVAWLNILESELDKNTAEFAQRGLYEVCYASVCCCWAMIKTQDLSLIRIIEWEYLFVGFAMVIAGIKFILAFPSAFSEWNKDREMNSKLGSHRREVAQIKRDQQVSIATGS